MPTTSHGLPYPVLSDDNNPPEDIQALAQGVDAAYGGSVANAGDLPASGAFPGQRVWLVDVKGFAVWNGTTWVADTNPVNLAPASGWTLGGLGMHYSRRGSVGFLFAHLERASYSASTLVGTLPPGVRPTRAILATAKAGTASVAVVINTDGTVVTGDPGTSGLVCSVSFPLA